MTSKTKLAEIAKLLEAEGGKHMGDLVWWKLSEQGVTVELVRKHWPAALAESHFPSDPDPAVAFGRAMKRAPLGQEEHRFESLTDTEEHLRTAVMLKREDSAAEKMRVRQVALFKFDKKAKAISVDDPDLEIVKRGLDLYADLCTRLTVDDVRKMVLGYIHDWSSVTMRDKGGMYWVPPTAAQEIRALASLLEGCGSSFYLLPLYESEAGKKVMAKIARESLEEQIRKLGEEIASFDLDKTRSKTTARRIEDLKAIRNKAETYSEILEMARSGLLKKVAKLERDAAKQFDLATGRESAKPATKKAKK